jgi:hypothetical protein
MHKPMTRFDDGDYADAVTIRDRVLSLLSDVAGESGERRQVRSPYSCPLRYKPVETLPWQLEVWFGAVRVMRFNWSDDGRKELQVFLKPKDWVQGLLQFGLP